MRLPARIFLITCGTISVALGVFGLFLPLLPTTPFLLLAAACYARSSEKLYDWLLGNRWFGQYIRNYREGKGIPLKRAAVAIALLWLTIGYTAIVAVSLWWVRLILLAIAGGVTVHLVRSRRAHGRHPGPGPARVPRPLQRRARTPPGPEHPRLTRVPPPPTEPPRP
ncbi:MAG: YbaN family protein [Gemmatimonadota bacterium]